MIFFRRFFPTVHNMGTEDRVSTVRIFPSAKVFDFIVFHAEHLKDFRVTPSEFSSRTTFILDLFVSGISSMLDGLCDV